MLLLMSEVHFNRTSAPKQSDKYEIAAKRPMAPHTAVQTAMRENHKQSCCCCPSSILTTGVSVSFCAFHASEMSRCLLRQLSLLNHYHHQQQHLHQAISCRMIHQSAQRLMAFLPPKKKADESSPGVKTKDIVRVKEFFRDQGIEDSRQFVDTIENYQNIRKVKRFGYAEFIGAALPAMKEFGVEKDLESYKALMRVFPAGAFIPSSKLASGFYPHFMQQRAAVDILCQMEENRLMPDKEMETHIIAVFSQYSSVWEKCARMTYWLTKFKNANPFPLPEKLPQDPLELAIVALKRMSLDPQSDVSIYSTSQIERENATEDTWICFAQSESQCRLIEELDAQRYRVSVDGPFQVWVEHFSVSYYVLFARDMSPKANANEDKVEAMLNEEHEKHNVSDLPLASFGFPDKEEALDPMRKLHIQEDGTILAVAATGTSSQSSLMTWVRILERENPRLRSIPVIISNKDYVQPLQGTDESRTGSSAPANE